MHKKNLIFPICLFLSDQRRGFLVLCCWQEPESFCLRMSSSVFRTISAPRLASAATAKSNILRNPKRTKVRSLLLVSVLMLVAKRLVKKRESVIGLLVVQILRINGRFGFWGTAKRNLLVSNCSHHHWLISRIVFKAPHCVLGTALEQPANPSVCRCGEPQKYEWNAEKLFPQRSSLR